MLFTRFWVGDFVLEFTLIERGMDMVPATCCGREYVRRSHIEIATGSGSDYWCAWVS